MDEERRRRAWKERAEPRDHHRIEARNEKGERRLPPNLSGDRPDERETIGDVALHLDVDERASRTTEVEHLGERRDTCALPEIDVREIVEREVLRATLVRSVRDAIEVLVVKDDHFTAGGESDVDFEPIGAERERAIERRQRVLGSDSPLPAVTDDERSISAKIDLSTHVARLFTTRAAARRASSIAPRGKVAAPTTG